MDIISQQKKCQSSPQGNNDFIPKISNQSPKITDNQQSQQSNSKQTKNVGTWTRNEDLIYFKFLKENQFKMSTEYLRRSRRVFKQLSIKLNKRRTPQQCRMHHNKMKMVAKTRNINKIMPFLIKKHGFSQQQQNNIQILSFSPTQNQTQKRKFVRRLPLCYNQISQCSYTIEKLFILSVSVNLNYISSW